MYVVLICHAKSTTNQVSPSLCHVLYVVKLTIVETVFGAVHTIQEYRNSRIAHFKNELDSLSVVHQAPPPSSSQ